LQGTPECSIRRGLPRGKFTLSLALQPQIEKPAYCGARIEGDDGRAISLCFLAKEGEECALVSFPTTLADGAWSLPGSEQQRVLEDAWRSFETLEIELQWDGAALTARWRDPSAKKWSADVPLDFPHRPRAVSLFVNRIGMLVKDVSIRGS
jgi:hypothetical protein